MASPIAMSRTRTASKIRPSSSGPRSRCCWIAAIASRTSSSRPRGRRDSQGDQVLVDVGADSRLDAVVRNDVDLDAEQFFQLLRGAAQQEQAGSVGQVHEQIGIRRGSLLASSDAAEDRTSLMPCLAAMASTAARRRRRRCPIGPRVGAVVAGRAGPRSSVRLAPVASTRAARVAREGSRVPLS